MIKETSLGYGIPLLQAKESLNSRLLRVKKALASFLSLLYPNSSSSKLKTNSSPAKLDSGMFTSTSLGHRCTCIIRSVAWLVQTWLRSSSIILLHDLEANLFMVVVGFVISDFGIPDLDAIMRRVKSGTSNLDCVGLRGLPLYLIIDIVLASQYFPSEVP
ncbi:hypothetical protein RIF29_25123 [Crotalaria pallida]|uniref:Uncharacterized protein n=1 Tax=Crotalaria pallida TaxID=3830 RepID=A0AAN9EL02_CROPI